MRNVRISAVTSKIALFTVITLFSTVLLSACGGWHPGRAEQVRHQELFALEKEARRKISQEGPSWPPIEKVLLAYSGFLKEFPDNAWAHYRLGVFCHDYSLWDLAEPHLKLAIDADPSMDLAHDRLGLLYAHTGRDIEAIEEFKKASELRPDEPIYHYHLAGNYAMTRHKVEAEYGWSQPEIFERSLFEYNRASELRPDDFRYAWESASHYRGAKYFGVDPRPDDELKAWERCLGLAADDSQRAIVVVHMAKVHLFQKRDKEKARSLLKRALSLDEYNPTAKYMLEKYR